MTILFASSEDIDLPLILGNYTGLFTGTITEDQDYVRYSFVMREGNTNKFKTDNYVPTTITTWLTFRVFYDSASSTTADADTIIFRNGTTEIATMDATNGVWRSKINDSGFVQVGNDFIMTNGTLLKITIQLVIHASEGVFNIWKNDILMTSFSGDTTGTHGQTQVDNITFSAANVGSSLDTFYSEIVVADEPTHNMRVAILAPNADGDDTAWTGDWANVDENAIDDADNLASSAANQVEMMNLAAYGGNTELKVRTVFVSARAAKSVISSILLEDDAGLLQLEDGAGNLLLEDGSGPEQIQLGIRHGATSAFSSTKTLPVDSLYGRVSDQFTVNPDTGIAWTVADLAALQAGVKSIA